MSNQNTVFQAIERLFGKPMTEEMRVKYRDCHTIEDLITNISNDPVTQALTTGEWESRTLTEMFRALRAECESVILFKKEIASPMI